MFTQPLPTVHDMTRRAQTHTTNNFSDPSNHMARDLWAPYGPAYGPLVFVYGPYRPP